MNRIAWICAAWMSVACVVHAEITHHGGSDEALPDQKYIHVVSEKDSPVMQTWIKAKDGLYIAAAVRKPKGDGPFPAIILFHGAPGGRGMDQLVGWSRGDHGGPVWERFLQEGYVVAVADYRGGDWNQMNAPSPRIFTGRPLGVVSSRDGSTPSNVSSVKARSGGLTGRSDGTSPCASVAPMSWPPRTPPPARQTNPARGQ